MTNDVSLATPHRRAHTPVYGATPQVAVRWRAGEGAHGASITDQKSPRGAPGTLNASRASHTSPNDVRQELRQRALRRRWSYYTLHYSLDTAGRQRASRVAYNERAAPLRVPNDARRPQLRRAARRLHFLHNCSGQTAAECAPPPPHRRAIAIPRTYRARGARRRRLLQSAARTRPPLSTALCPVAVRASRRAAVRPARHAAARYHAYTARGVRFLLRWRAALGAVSAHVTSHQLQTPQRGAQRGARRGAVRGH